MRDGQLRKPPLIDPFEVGFPGSEATVRAGLRTVMTNLAPLGLGVEEAGTVELVLAEALNNIVEHALPDVPESTDIRIRCSHASDGLHLVIIDHGVPMPDETAPGAVRPEVRVAVDVLPEGGFGWFMIHTLAEDVSYSRQDDANHLCLRLAVGV